MVCCVEKNNQLKPAGGNSGMMPLCTATLVGFFIEENTMKKIPLTQGKFAIVDDGDFEELSKHKWCIMKSGRNAFRAVRGIWKNERRITVYMHRVVMNAPKNLDVDHINHNPLDNRKCNLRVCTKSQNQHNQQLHKDGSSRFKGVSINRQVNKWAAAIKFKSKSISIGLFGSEVEAAKAYDEKAKELFGEYAYVNFKNNKV